MIRGAIEEDVVVRAGNGVARPLMVPVGGASPGDQVPAGVVLAVPGEVRGLSLLEMMVVPVEAFSQ